MNLAQWTNAVQELRMLANEHGHSEIPIPAAMAALNANSRPTFYRRLAELRETGWFASLNERNNTLAVLAPEDVVTQTIEDIRKAFSE